MPSPTIFEMSEYLKCWLLGRSSNPYFHGYSFILLLFCCIHTVGWFYAGSLYSLNISSHQVKLVPMWMNLLESPFPGTGRLFWMMLCSQVSLALSELCSHAVYELGVIISLLFIALCVIFFAGEAPMHYGCKSLASLVCSLFCLAAVSLNWSVACLLSFWITASRSPRKLFWLSCLCWAHI